MLSEVQNLLMVHQAAVLLPSVLGHYPPRWIRRRLVVCHPSRTPRMITVTTVLPASLLSCFHP
jgi:hypothetical protein